MGGLSLAKTDGSHHGLVKLRKRRKRGRRAGSSEAGLGATHLAIPVEVAARLSLRSNRPSGMTRRPTRG